MPKDFVKALKQRPLVFDGATGTMLQKLGLKPGGCPDGLNLTNPDIVKKVHGLYVSAGSDVVTTNTFGANRIKLREYGLEGRLEEINVAAVGNAREAAGKKSFVAGCIGPTGRFVEPVGDMDFDEAVSVFGEQAGALKKGGADLIIIETMMDIKEMKAAIIAASATGLPVVATMTFDSTMRTVLGTPPEAFAIIADSLGVAALGANCSLGSEGIYRAVSAMSRVMDVPLIAQPNAGIPTLKGRETVFPETPDDMAEYAPRLAGAGVRILGGCCGTTPEHIKAMGGVFRALKPEKGNPKKTFTCLAGRTSFTAFGAGLAPITVGERINPTGRKSLAQEIQEGKTSIIRTEAREQEASGAHALDVNVGVPDIDEKAAMKRAVFAVNENCRLPVVIDSADPAVIEEGLKAVDGKPLINSISGEEKKLEAILPLAKKYGAAILGLTLDDNGIPAEARGRLKVAEKILERALDNGLKKQDVVIDCLAMTISADPKSARETLEAIRLVKEKLGLATILGVSNISFGLPSRETINTAFLTMAIEAGLDCAIMNTKNQAMMDAYHASSVLLGHDEKGERYIERFREKEPSGTAGGPSRTTNRPSRTAVKGPTGIKERLMAAVVEGDGNNITVLVEEALREGWEPLKVGSNALIPGLDEVGRLFASNRYFLPQVISSADAVKKAFERLKREMKGATGPAPGRVVMATVKGDIHDIGKNIVCTLLENHGFEVIDLGKNVPAEKIVEAAVAKKADVVGLSALMTTTVMEMDNVIKKLKKQGVAAKTVVGGAVVTPEFAKRIGADEYGGEATEAVKKIKRLVKAK
ncbi:MAG: homocysteine S-methyltransferase family protein [Deltaproteobacteria bacterium]|nr:homocysteine S-methyltransferase family protein [Deltaproteobacteria bacterium]